MKIDEARFYSPVEIAKILQTSRQFVYKLIRDYDNPLRCVKVGSCLRIRGVDFIDYIERNIYDPLG